MVKQAHNSAKDWEEEPEGANKNKESSADSAKKRPPDDDGATQIPRPSSPKDTGYSVDKVIRDYPGISISKLRQWGYPDAEIIPLFSMSFLQQDVDEGGIGANNIPMVCEKYAAENSDAILKYCPSVYRGFDKDLGYTPAQIAEWITFQYPHRLIDWGYTERDVIDYIKSNRDYKIGDKRAFIQQLHVYVRDVKNPTDKPWLNADLLL
jgi:hypothetical protein